MRYLLVALALLSAPATAQTFTDSLSASDRSIASGEYADDFRLTLDPDRSLVADLRSADFRPYLIAIGPGGEQLENQHWGGIGHARIEVPDAAAGLWRVIVTSTEVGETGAYTLVIEADPRSSEPAPQPAPTPPPASPEPTPAPPEPSIPESEPVPEPDPTPDPEQASTPPASDDGLRGGTIVPERGGFVWVLGSAQPDAAEARAARYRAEGFRAAMLTGRSNGRTIHRIVVGQFATREAAEAARDRLPADAPPDAWILALGS